jgi:hypothetical protein
MATTMASRVSASIPRIVSPGLGNGEGVRERGRGLSHAVGCRIVSEQSDCESISSAQWTRRRTPGCSGLSRPGEKQSEQDVCLSRIDAPTGLALGCAIRAAM